MRYTLRYGSTRREVWRYYWRAWRHPRGLWRTHLSLVIAIGLTIFVLRGGTEARAGVPIALAWALLAVAWFPIYPLIAFKPDERTLHVDDQGIDTTIGTHAARRSWSEIASIEDRDGAIVVTGKNGNAFIIPRRAFASDAERAEVLSQVTRWFQEATTNSFVSELGV